METIREATDLQEGDNRTVESVADLTFGEYVRLLEREDNWATLGLSLDRRTFVELLHEIRKIRNDVMHFHPDGIGDEDLEKLRNCTRFFQALAPA
jgi:hypothetical protein